MMRQLGSIVSMMSVMTCLNVSAAIANDFLATIAPMLTRHCMECHNAREAAGGLTLEHREGMLLGGEHGAVVVAGKPEKSRLLQFVSSGKMPKKRQRLSDTEVGALRQWIESGAIWPDDIRLNPFAKTTDRRAGLDWWSLIPIREPAIPNLEDDSWSRNPIDKFVLQKLRQKQLRPAPDATPHILLRRAKFDLLGLPPEPQELDAFAADDSGQAYERVVDDLLKSPHFGERWARHWLDVVRFTESDGFENDAPRPHAWPYRDYVIQSFNNDKPYDQFIREQIAGDVLKPVTREGVIATGFLVAGPWDHAPAVSGSKIEKLRAREKSLEEMVTVISQSLMGLTVNCARCHDHKFDPISQNDYYRVKAVFEGVDHTNGSSRRALPAFSAEGKKQNDAKIAALKQRIAELEAQANSISRKLDALNDSTHPRPLNRAIAIWQFAEDEKSAPDLKPLDPAGVRRHSKVEAKWSMRFKQTPLEQIRAINSDNLVANTGDGRIQQNVPGGAGYGIIANVDNTELIPPENRSVTAFARVRFTGSFNGTDDVFRVGDTGNEHKDTYGLDFIADGETQKTARARFSTTGHDQETEASVMSAPLQLDRWYDLAGVFDSAAQTMTIYVHDPMSGAPIAEPVTTKVDYSSLNRGGRQNLLFFVAPSFRNGPQPHAQLDLAAVWYEALTADQVSKLSAVEESKPSPEVAAEQAQMQQLGTDLKAQRKPIMDELAKQKRSLNRLPKFLAFFGERRQPKPTVVYSRGNILIPGEEVVPAGLSAISAPPADLSLQKNAPEAERRIAFARWLTDPRHPLTARVIVNRVWQHYFGHGLVRRTSDFGFNGGTPSHPELLDWLTTQFIRDGWSLKSLHRRILLSATYRQSSRYDSKAAGIDAENRLLWRFTPRRLEGEIVRDAILAVSGKLHAEVGGPSFQPFSTTRFNTTFYHLFDKDEPKYNRRSIYRMGIITGRDAMLDAFDCPSPSVLAPQRPVTTTPQQALALMNNSFVQRQAAAFAARVAGNAGTEEERIRLAYRMALGRPPGVAEIKQAVLLTETTGLQNLCWVLLNCSEFLYVQ